MLKNKKITPRQVTLIMRRLERRTPMEEIVKVVNVSRVTVDKVRAD